jgi:RNA polymerase sigma factor (sigma-70 family)
MPDDPELLRRYADSASEDAFAELVRRHIGTVYAAALRRVGGDAHLAEDVTQEVFTDLARKAGSLAQRGFLVGWLFVAARFAASKAVRRDRQRQALWRKALAMTEREQAAAGEPDWEALRPELDEAIGALRAAEREAILLYYFEQGTFEEVGRALAVSESGARMRVERALEKLRLSLRRRGITSTAAALAAALGTQAAAAVPASLSATITTSALAAAVPAGAAATLLLMSITKTQLGATLALVLCGATYLGVAQHQRISTLQKQNNVLSAQSATESKRAQSLALKLEAANQALASAQARLAQSGPAVSGNGNGVKVVHIKDIIAAHPEFAALERKELRHNIIRQYARAIEALKLPPDQAAQVKELLVERESASSDARQAALDAGIADNTPEMGKANAQAEAALNQALDALLGPDGRGKLEALRGNSFYGSSNGIDDLAVDLMDAGLGISPDEVQTLAQTQHDLEDSAKNPMAATPGYRTLDHDTWERPLDLDFFAKAAAFLTPDQLQIVKTSRAEENQRQAIMREFTGNGAAMIID